MIDTATRVSASTKLKMGLALGLSGAAFAVLAAGVGAVPRVSKVVVNNDTTVYTGPLKPGPNVVLARFALATAGGEVSVQSVDVQTTGQRVSSALVHDPYHLLFYVCGSGYGYGGYGYDGCRVIDVPNHTTVAKTDKQSTERFTLGTGLTIPSGSRVWFDAVSAVDTPTIRGGALLFNVTKLVGTVSSGKLITQVGASRTRPRTVIATGDVIKIPGLSALFYIGSDGKRYVFPNTTTYDSWYKNRKETLTIEHSQLTSYLLGGNVTIRPGTYLIKMTSSPKVYAIEPGGVLKYFQSESAIKSLYGKNWTRLVIDVPDVFFANYRNGGELKLNTISEGSLVKFKGSEQKYLIRDGKRSPIISIGFTANRFDDAFVIKDVDPAKFVYQDYAPTMAFEPLFSAPAGPLTGYGPTN